MRPKSPTQMPIAAPVARGGEIASSLDSSTVSTIAGYSQLLMLRRWGAYVRLKVQQT